MNLAQEIQTVNEFVVSSIEDGYFDEATDVLLHLITKISGLMLLPSPIHVGPYGDEDGNNNNNKGIDDVYSTEQRCEDPLEQGERDIKGFYGHPFIHQYPEAFLESTEPILSSEQYNTTALICLFNLGLCYQLKWDESRSKTELLHEALEHYQEAISFLLNDMCSFIPQGPIVKVLLGICVNAAHCHAELMQPHGMEIWVNITQDMVLKFCSQEVLQSVEFFTMKRLFDRRSLPTTNAPAAAAAAAVVE